MGAPRKIGVILGVFLVVAFGGVAWGAEIKIGYVDLQKALNESQHGKDAKAKFSQEVKERQKEITPREEELKSLGEELQKKAMILKEDAIKEKGDELKKKTEDFQRFFLQSEEELKRRETQLTRDVIKGLEMVVKELAVEKGYTFIFEKMEGGIIYGPEADDITNEVIKRYNKLYNKNKKK